MHFHTQPTCDDCNLVHTCMENKKNFHTKFHSNNAKIYTSLQCTYTSAMSTEHYEKNLMSDVCLHIDFLQHIPSYKAVHIKMYNTRITQFSMQTLPLLSE